MKAGVPLNKLDVFRDFLEENGYRLAGRRPMSDPILLILSEEKQRIKEDVSGKDVSMVFDATSRLGEAVVIVLHFIHFDSWSLQKRRVYLQLLAKTMCGEEIARELKTILSPKLSIPPGKLQAAMRDWVSSNCATMRTLKVVYQNLLDIGCTAIQLLIMSGSTL